VVILMRKKDSPAKIPPARISNLTKAEGTVARAPHISLHETPRALNSTTIFGSHGSLTDRTDKSRLGALPKPVMKLKIAGARRLRPSFHPTTEAANRRAGLRTWLVFDSYGNVSLLEAQKQQVIRRTGVNARDLRILDPGSHAPASILSRDKALVCNLQHIKLILCADQVMLLVSGEDWQTQNHLLAEFVEDLRLRLKSSRTGFPKIESKASNMTGMEFEDSESESHEQFSAADKGYHSDGDDRDNEDIIRRFGPKSLSRAREEKVHDYYEFKVLEGALESVCSTLARQALELEQEVLKSLAALTKKVTMFNLEGLRQVKGKMTRLISKVTQVKDELGHLLDNDDDMNEMYLTRKLVEESPKGRDSRFLSRSVTRNNSTHANFNNETGMNYDIDELEDLLETFHERIFGTFNKLHALSEYIDDTEDFISISQDSHRNKLIQIDLVMTSLSFSLTFLAMVASVFGMNVTSGLEENERAFDVIIMVSAAIAIMAFAIFMVFAHYQKLL